VAAHITSHRTAQHRTAMAALRSLFVCHSARGLVAVLPSPCAHGGQLQLPVV